MSDTIGGILALAVLAFGVYARANPKMTVGEALRKLTCALAKVRTAANLVLVVLFGLVMAALGLWGIIAFVHWAWRHS